MIEWIEARRKEIISQRDQMAANLNMCNGALQMLDAMQAEVIKPDAPQGEPVAAAAE